MLVDLFPDSLKQAISDLQGFESWQVLAIALGVLFVLAVISGGIAALFRRNTPAAKYERSYQEEDVLVRHVEHSKRKRIDESKKTEKKKRAESPLDEPSSPPKSEPKKDEPKKDPDNPLWSTPAPEKIALVDDSEVTTHVEKPKEEAEPLLKKPKPKIEPINSTTEAEQAMSQLGAQMGRDRSDNVVMLFLNGKDVTKEHLKGLQYFRMLESLHLRRTKIQDDDLDSLAQLKRLKFLYITDTKVTEDGVKKLKSSKPELTVEL